MYPIAGGEFWFPGVRSGLKDHFRDVPPRVSKFSLYFSIDGLPLHKSTRKQFWPILMSIQEMPEVPVLMVGNFFGESKPKSVEEYLRPLVDELNGLMDNGIVIANKLIEIHVQFTSTTHMVAKNVRYKEDITAHTELHVSREWIIQQERMKISSNQITEHIIGKKRLSWILRT
ncbi:uncharacterized protein LOC121602871 isoform X2 [Anopheles merus]|nr:uncharacterized protein LOC121602871 isoform X2 [Anopheles merus]